MVKPGRGKSGVSTRSGGRSMKKSARTRPASPPSPSSSDPTLRSRSRSRSRSPSQTESLYSDSSPTGSETPLSIEENIDGNEAYTMERIIEEPSYEEHLIEEPSYEEPLTEERLIEPYSRVPPMTSNRRRRLAIVCRESPHPKEVDTIDDSRSILEDNEIPLCSLREEGGGEDGGPFPGGPEDSSILKSYKTHVACAIWEEQDRFPLKCIHHAHKLVEWKLDDECDRFKQKVAQSGLASLAHYSYRYIDRVLVSAFVERWHPETNTFHLPFGEMTITLDDVKQILSIPILGRTVSGPTVNYADAERLLTKGLGVSAADAQAEIERSFSVRMEWLRTKLSGVSPDASEERLDCSVRGYLLYLLGCTLFADKTGTRISVFYLQSLMNLEQVGEYSWGSGGLAYLYRQLGHASRAGVKQIAGYLTLLEAWIYEHFRVNRPTPDLSYVEHWPRVRRWKPKIASGDPCANLQVIREQLDDLSPFDVTWDPYKDCRQYHPFEDVAYYTGCLLCYEIVEPYHPERVLRQFGRVQTIPHPPFQPTKATRGMTSQKYKVEYPLLDQYWSRWQSHVLSVKERGRAVMNPWDCASDYLQWFHKITHKFVQNPQKRTGRQPYQPIMGGDVEDVGDVVWRQHRDKALALLETSLALGKDQNVDAMLDREREIYEILTFDRRISQ